jgi:hypothetical protein
MSGVREYRFDEELARSDSQAIAATVTRILIENIPGAIRVERAGHEQDRSGVDFWVVRQSGGRVGVDVKARQQDFRYVGPRKDDLALETWSNVERRVPGWSLDASKATDYVLWIWPTQRWCLIPFPLLCAVTTECLDHWTRFHQVHRQRTPDLGFHSECVIVPRLAVLRAIDRKFGGDSILGSP